MEGPAALAAGSVLAFLGGALLLWCAAQMRLRHRLRRLGVPVTAPPLPLPDAAEHPRAAPVPGRPVRVRYDRRRPARVVLTGLGIVTSLPRDVFWTLLGTSSLAGGLSLLAAALRH